MKQEPVLVVPRYLSMVGGREAGEGLRQGAL